MMRWLICEHGQSYFGKPSDGCVCRFLGPAPMVADTRKINRWVRMVKLLRKPEDSGLGDTVQRIAAKFGGERFKAFAKRIGIPCGCSDRQAEWNRLFPY